MAEHSGFFNALSVNGVYDRTYTANDYTDNLAVVIPNGVYFGEDNTEHLKVTKSGMVLTVQAGRAWINGHYYFNDTAMTLPAVQTLASGSRYDRVMLRMNKNVNTRAINIVYVQGTAATNPTAPEPTRNNNVYDLVLATVKVTAGSSSLTLTDTRADPALCGKVYSPATIAEDMTELQTEMTELRNIVSAPLKLVLVGDSYTVKAETGDGRTDPTTLFDNLVWSQKYCVSGTGCFDNSWKNGVNGLTADNAVTHVVVLTGVNDCTALKNGTVNETTLKTNINQFILTCKAKFPNAKVHLYFCGNTFSGEEEAAGIGYRDAKYKVFSLYKECESADFEVVQGSWTLLTAKSSTKDTLHPTLAAAARMYRQIGRSIRSGFKPIYRAETQNFDASNCAALSHSNISTLQLTNAHATVNGEHGQLAWEHLYIRMNNLQQESKYIHPIGIVTLNSQLVSGHSAPHWTFQTTTMAHIELTNNSYQTTVVTTPVTVTMLEDTIWINHRIDTGITDNYPYVVGVLLDNVLIDGDLFSITA